MLPSLEAGASGEHEQQRTTPSMASHGRAPLLTPWHQHKNSKKSQHKKTGISKLIMITNKPPQPITDIRYLPRCFHHNACCCCSGRCVEAVYNQLKGVQSVVSGYAGGHTRNPTYEQVTWSSRRLGSACGWLCDKYHSSTVHSLLEAASAVNITADQGDALHSDPAPQSVGCWLLRATLFGDCAQTHWRNTGQEVLLIPLTPPFSPIPPKPHSS